MDLDYGLEYRELYQNHWWWRARERFILQAIEAVAPATPVSILDVGCGDGVFFERLSSFGHVEGVESCGEIVRDDNPWKHQIHIGEFDERFNPGKRYDLVLMLDVLEHFADPEKRIRRALDLLKPDGFLIITVPAFLSLWTSHDELNRHVTRYIKSSLAELATNTGMNVLSQRYFFHWMFPIKWLIALKERLIQTKPRVPRVPPAALNRALYWLSVCEQKALANVPVPFGNSLLAIAAKMNNHA
jgi:SAM-dependent methyltransferase